jgi:hypothetical protein
VCASIRAGFESGLNSEPASTGTIQLWCGRATASRPPVAVDPWRAENGCRHPYNGRRQPRRGLRCPKNGCRRPQGGCRPPRNGRSHPENGYRHPSGGCSSPRHGRHSCGKQSSSSIRRWPPTAKRPWSTERRMRASAGRAHPATPRSFARQAARTGGLPFQSVDPIRNRTAPAAAPGPHRRLRLRNGCIRRAGRHGR